MQELQGQQFVDLGCIVLASPKVILDNSFDQIRLKVRA